MISRAQALLIIIGNPNTLSQDKNWDTVVKYCRRNKAFVYKDTKNIIGTSVEETDKNIQNVENVENNDSEVLSHNTSLRTLLTRAINTWITRLKTRLINYLKNP